MFLSYGIEYKRIKRKSAEKMNFDYSLFTAQSGRAARFTLVARFLHRFHIAEVTDFTADN